MELTKEPNDCSICAIMNAAEALGLTVARDEVKKWVEYVRLSEDGKAEAQISW